MSVTVEAADPNALVNDGALLRTFLDSLGDEKEQAFAELVRRHAGMVLGHCRRKLNDAAFAEDATQAVFIILARKAGKLRAEGALAGWLYRTAELVTRSMNRDYRTRSRHEDIARSETPTDSAREAQPDPEALMALRGKLDDALWHLKASEREAVLLHYLEGLPQQQAAQRLGLEYATYRQRLFRALERLREYFGSRGEVLSVSAIGTVLHALGRADAASVGVGLQSACIHGVTGKVAVSKAVQSIVQGVLNTMLQKSILMFSGIAALLILGMVTMLMAADTKPPVVEKVAVPPLPPKPAQDPKGPVASEPLQATHLMLDQIKAVGRPVFSPDGRWLAVREDGNKLALIDMAQTLKDPKTQPARFDMAAAVKSSAWGDHTLGEAAAFSTDGQCMVFSGKEGLMKLDLPVKGPPLPMTGFKEEKLGVEYFPALNASKSGVYPLIKLIKAAVAEKGMAQGRSAEVQLVTYRRFVEGNEQRMPGSVIRHDSLKWAPDGKQLYATLDDGSAAVIDAFSAQVMKKFDIQTLNKSTGKPFDSIRVVQATPDGKFVIEGLRQYPPEMRNMEGTYTPRGEEKAERGRNPGSAEPGPGMPRYMFLCEGEKITRIWMASCARHLDTQWVLPSDKADKYFYFQIANEGGAGHGIPHAWLGQLDASGKRSEMDLGNPIQKTVDAPVFELVDLAPDASKALVLMRANRIKKVPLKLDEETRKKINDDLKSKKISGVSHNGPEGLMKMFASAMIFQKYQRSGGAEDDHDVTMTFSTWQLWDVDAVQQTIRPVSPEFGEAIGELENIVGMPGAPGSVFSSPLGVYSASAGLLAMTLEGMKSQPGLGFNEPRGLALIKVQRK